jgi:hypothetical protein
MHKSVSLSLFYYQNLNRVWQVFLKSDTVEFHSYFYQITRRNIPQGKAPHIHKCVTGITQ